MSASKPLLWHIWISHYSEKARWALDYKGSSTGGVRCPADSHDRSPWR